MEQALEIFKHIEDLYSSRDVPDSEISKIAELRPEMFSAWQEAFKGYDLNDEFRVIDEFWRYTNNKTRPKVAQLLSMLNTTKDVQKTSHGSPTEKVRYFCIESDLMTRDRMLGRNPDLFYKDYCKAVKHIIDVKLFEALGKEEYSKLLSDDKVQERSNKYKAALARGLFNDFDRLVHELKYGHEDSDKIFGDIERYAQL